MLGDNTLQLLILNNGNPGSGNDFDPGLGIDGTGRIILGTIDVPNVRIYDPDQGSFTGASALTSLDFGTLHVGDAGHLRYALTNLSGNAGWPSFGAIQTLTHGGTVTDPALSGSGVTPQDFGIGPRGGTATFELTLDTMEARLLQDQAVHIGFEFQGFQSDTGTTLPITGAVLNYADPGFALVSGPGTLAGRAPIGPSTWAAWPRAAIPGQCCSPSATSPWRRPTISAAASTSRARASRWPALIPSPGWRPGMHWPR
ncbi:hypothetical protein [Dankookia sp. P2]|uniref:hypothetical protein n=1 Tax=Dankookia sp. P2 TaxID=3423955 RepID=UPI003D66445C